MRIRGAYGIVCHVFFGDCTTYIPDIIALPNVPFDQFYCIELAIKEEIKAFPNRIAMGKWRLL
jgi:protein transport protein SEC24